ncbi:MAG: replicative DNA helicase [Planctomycetes bacterium]|nr:replicative DNA helicase [Planctomycetota bacterium]
MPADTTVEPFVPSDLDAERGVLGSALLDREVFGRVVQILGAEDFHATTHQHIYAAMMDLFDRNEPIDALLLKARLEKAGTLDKVGGIEYLLSLAEAVPSAASADYYANLVKEKAIMRTLIAAGEDMIRAARSSGIGFREILDEVERKVLGLGQGLITGQARRMDQLLTETLDRLDAMQGRQGHITGLATGFSELDEIINGLQPSQLVVVAGRPSMGKTTFALNVSEHVGVEHNVAVLIFSLEMSSESLVENMLCSRAEVNAHKLKRGMLAAPAWTRLGEVAADLGSAPIFIDSTPGMTALEIRAKARRLKQTHNLGLVVIDYLQLLEMGGASRSRPESRQQEIAAISRGLKGLARELNIPVIAISQLNRAVEQRQKEDFRPRMSDLRESGAIEQDADVILFLYRDEYYHRDREESKGKAEVIVSKQRSGPTGVVQLNFTGEFMRFRNLARTVDFG